MRKIRVDCAFEVKRLSTKGDIEGYGAVFGNIDHGLDRIEPGAFSEFLASHKGPIPMLWQHDASEPIGVWEGLAEDKKGLYVRGKLNLSRESGMADVPMAYKARALAEQGAVTGLSIGYYPVKHFYEDEVRVLEKLDVVEVSLATFPMNERARVAGVKNATNKELAQLLRENMGLSRQAAEAFMAHGKKGLREVIGSVEDGNGGIEEVADSLNRFLNIIKG